MQAKQFLRELDESDDEQLDIVIDVHASDALLGVFISGNSYDDVYRFERHTVFPKILSQNCPDYNPDNTNFNADVAKDDTARRVLGTELQSEVDCYSLEVSLLGFVLKEEQEKVYPYDEELYSFIGVNLANSFWDYYKILGNIPFYDKDPNCDSRQENGSFNLIRLREIANQREENQSQQDKSGTSQGADRDRRDSSKRSSILSVRRVQKASEVSATAMEIHRLDLVYKSPP